MTIKESVPIEQIIRDNHHGTNWKWLNNREENGMVKPCQCDGQCTNQEPKNTGGCENCGTYYCSYCHGYRAYQTFVSDEGSWATYGYHQPTNEWDIWAN